MNERLRFENVSKTYRHAGGEVTALADVGFCLTEGEILFVHGPSGSGKSTLLLCAGGLLQPETGTVSVVGEDVYALSGEARARLRARQIGFVFQQFHLIPFFNVIENVMAPSLAGYDGDPLRRAEALVEQFGLEARRSHSPAALSVGERQRVALARALFASPQVILADEPTGNLDGDNAARVMDGLSAFAKAGGAVLVVTHAPHLITGNALKLVAGRLEKNPE